MREFEKPEDRDSTVYLWVERNRVKQSSLFLAEII